MTVPGLAFQAVWSLFHQDRDLFGEQMVSFPPEINEDRKFLGKPSSGTPALDTVYSSPEGSC